MSKQDIRTTIAALTQELKRKVSQRDTLNIEIVRLEQNIKNLRVFVIKDALASTGQRLTSVGLTEAIRTVLRTNGKPMTAADVKMALTMIGFDLARFKNPSAAVHNTLIRMVNSRHLTFLPATKAYRLFRTFYGASGRDRF